MENALSPYAEGISNKREIERSGKNTKLIFRNALMKFTLMAFISKVKHHRGMATYNRRA
jgi:hypothetical protein